MALKFFHAPKTISRATNGTPKEKSSLEVNDNGRIMFSEKFLKSINFDHETARVAFAFDDEEGSKEVALLILPDEISQAGVCNFKLRPKSINSKSLRDEFYARWKPKSVELETYATDEDGVTLLNDEDEPIINGSELRFNRLLFKIDQEIEIEGLKGYTLSFIGEKEPVKERVYSTKPGKRK